MNSEGEELAQKVSVNFDEILKHEDYVICDYSISSKEKGIGWYENSIYDINRFSELDFSSTEKEIESMKSFLSLLSNSKVLVTSGISCEIFTMVNLLRNKIKHLSLRKDPPKHSGKRFTRDANEESIGERMLNEIYNFLNESYAQSRRSEFSPAQKQVYSFLEKIVLGVAEHTGVKIDYGKVYNPNRKPKKVEDFHTDEQLVATALYLSVFEGKSGCILTRDSDIRRILFYTQSYLSYFDKTEYKEILDSIVKNRIRIYYGTEIRNAHIDYESPKFSPKSRARIPPEKLLLIESQIKPLNPFIAQI